MSNTSIITGKAPVLSTPLDYFEGAVHWRVDDFNQLISTQGYAVYVDKALPCPCRDKSNGQALVSCKNCLGKGWIFVDRKQTIAISQSMNNIKQLKENGEIDKGEALITIRGVDKLGFMDRIIMMDLVANHSENLNPIMYNDELIAYPLYEPIQISNIFLFVGSDVKLYPISNSEYSIQENKIVFSKDIIEMISVQDINDPVISVSLSYTHHPVYHVVDFNRELMRVRQQNASNTEHSLTDMPICVRARKAYYIFDSQKYGNELLDNTTTP